MLAKYVFCVFIFILTFCNQICFADEACKLDSDWHENTVPGAIFSLKQTQSVITGETSLFGGSCGKRPVLGSIDAGGFVVKLLPVDHAQGICQMGFEWRGQFRKECNSIYGEMVDSEGHSEPFQMFQLPIKIVGPDPQKDLLITKEPRMPAFDVQAIFAGPWSYGFAKSLNKLTYIWSVEINHVLGDTGKKLSDKFKEETENPVYTPNFDLLNGLRGGELKLSVTYYDELSDSKKYIIKGTNPGETAINQVITGQTLRHIACTESAYRQFEAKREGGIGIPLIGITKNKDGYKKNGGIGLMQLYYKKDEEIPDKNIVWNWRQNIVIGKKLFHEKQSDAKKMYMAERNRLNSERAKLGLPACPSGTPPQLNAEQLERETIRRYVWCRV